MSNALGDIAVNLGLAYDQARSDAAARRMVEKYRSVIAGMSAAGRQAAAEEAGRQSMASGMVMAAKHAAVLRDQFRAFRVEATQATHAVHSMASAMSGAAQASSRMLAGMGVSGAAARARATATFTGGQAGLDASITRAEQSRITNGILESIRAQSRLTNEHRNTAQILQGIRQNFYIKRFADEKQYQAALANTNQILQQARTPLQGLYGTWRRVQSVIANTKQDVHQMTAAMSGAAAASARMLSGMGMSGAAARTQSILGMARTPLANYRAIRSAQIAEEVAQRRLLRQDLYRIDAAESLLRLRQRGTVELMKQAQLADLTHLGGRGGGGYGSTRSSSRSTMMILELGRGIEDAAIGFQMQGLAGAFRGAANNAGVLLSQLGKFGPYLMLASSLGVAWWGVSNAFGSVADKAKDAADRVKELVEAMRTRFEEQVRERDRIQQLRELPDMTAAGEAMRTNNAQYGPVYLELMRLQKLKADWDAWEQQTTDNAKRYANQNWLDAELAKYAADRLAIEQRLAEVRQQAESITWDAIEIERRVNTELQEQEDHRLNMLQLRREYAATVAREGAQQELLGILNPAEARRRQIRDEAAAREEAFTNDRSISTNRIEELIRLNAIARESQLAQVELDRFREQNGPLIGRTFGDAGVAGSLEQGTQEAFRAIIEARRDPDQTIEQISRDQLKALNRIARQLERRAEGAGGEEVLDL